jgi:hypothetical protein
MGPKGLAIEAREIGRSNNFPPAAISEALDLLFIAARRGEPGTAGALVTEVEVALANTAGAHYHQWSVRLATAQAELAIARGEIAVTAAGPFVRRYPYAASDHAWMGAYSGRWSTRPPAYQAV